MPPGIERGSPRPGTRPLPGGLPSSRGKSHDLAPSLHPRYRGFITTTSRSTSRSRVGTRPLAVSAAWAPGFDATFVFFDRSAAIHLRSPFQFPPDTSCGVRSSSLTTTVFSQRSMRRFEASPRRATPRVKPSSLAQHHFQNLSYYQLPFMFGTQDHQDPPALRCAGPSALFVVTGGRTNDCTRFTAVMEARGAHG